MRRTILVSLMTLLPLAGAAASVGDASELVRALNLYHDGYSRAGVHLLRGYLAAHPDDVEARRTLAGFYADMGLASAARRELTAVLHQVPQSTEDRIQLMRLSARAGSWPEALELAESVLELRPEEPEALGVAGRAHFNLQQAAEALPLLQRAVDAGLDEPGVHNMLGLLRLHRDQVDAARRQFDRAVSLEPDRAIYHNNLGYAQELGGDLEGAWMSYDRALSLQPASAGFSQNLARVEAELRSR